MNEVLRLKALEMVVRYRAMEETMPGSSQLREIKDQYRDMAAGGDGGSLGFEDPITGADSCRAVNYPGYPNAFFQEVRDLMGWP